MTLEFPSFEMRIGRRSARGCGNRGLDEGEGSCRSGHDPEVGGGVQKWGMGKVEADGSLRYR